HTRFSRDWSSDVCSSDLLLSPGLALYVISVSGRLNFLILTPAANLPHLILLLPPELGNRLGLGAGGANSKGVGRQVVEPELLPARLLIPPRHVVSFRCGFSYEWTHTTTPNESRASTA